jgi:hypothetical protein
LPGCTLGNIDGEWRGNHIGRGSMLHSYSGLEKEETQLLRTNAFSKNLARNPQTEVLPAFIFKRDYVNVYFKKQYLLKRCGNQKVL